MSDTGNPIELARFAPPQARIAEPVETGQRVASRGTRLGAAVVDIVIQVVAFMVLSFAVIPRLLPLLPANRLPSILLPILLYQGLSLVVFLLLHGYLLVRSGQTLGKRVLGIRIVRPDGAAVGAMRLLGLRYGVGFVVAGIPLVGAIYVLVDTLMIFGEQRRCLHDRIADTIVIHA